MTTLNNLTTEKKNYIRDVRLGLEQEFARRKHEEIMLLSVKLNVKMAVVERIWHEYNPS